MLSDKFNVDAYLHFYTLMRMAILYLNQLAIRRRIDLWKPVKCT